MHSFRSLRSLVPRSNLYLPSAANHPHHLARSTTQINRNLGLQHGASGTRLHHHTSTSTTSPTVRHRTPNTPPSPQPRTMSTSQSTTSAQIESLQGHDYADWEKLFRAYIDFYETTIPDEQYARTFQRLIKPDGDLQALVLRGEDEALLGIAHFYTHQTPWSEGSIMHLNDLYIVPELRGQGYGRKMIQAVADHAKEAGCFRLKWATQHGNPARRLYDEMATCDFVEYRMKLS